jgi:hypothetical protein
MSDGTLRVHLVVWRVNVRFSIRYSRDLPPGPPETIKIRRIASIVILRPSIDERFVKGLEAVPPAGEAPPNVLLRHRVTSLPHALCDSREKTTARRVRPGRVCPEVQWPVAKRVNMSTRTGA